MFFKATFSDYIDFRDKGIRNFFEYETGVYILYTFEYIGNMKYIVKLLGLLDSNSNNLT